MNVLISEINKQFQQKLKLIVARDRKTHGIGNKNSLAWKISDDLKFFKSMTENNTCIFGHNTFKSFGSRPLPNRLNIVLTSKWKEKQNIIEKNLYFVGDMSEALLLAWYFNYGESIWLYGGQCMHDYAFNCSEHYITEVDVPNSKEDDYDTFLTGAQLTWYTCGVKETIGKIQQNENNQYNCEITKVNVDDTFVNKFFDDSGLENPINKQWYVKTKTNTYHFGNLLCYVHIGKLLDILKIDYDLITEIKIY